MKILWRDLAGNKNYYILLVGCGEVLKVCREMGSKTERKSRDFSYFSKAGSEFPLTGLEREVKIGRMKVVKKSYKNSILVLPNFKDGASFCYSVYVLCISVWSEELEFLKDDT